MDIEYLFALVAAIPVIAFFVEFLVRADITERHHIHHDTYSISIVVSRTLALVMAFMGVLGVLTSWLCHLGVYAHDPVVLLSFFAAFQVSLLTTLIAVRRYQVVTYADRLVVRPFYGRAQTIMYRDIARMSWVKHAWGGSIHDLLVQTYGGEVARIWGLLDTEQMLLRIDRYDVLDT